MQTYPGLMTFFYQFFLHFKEGKIWCFVSSLVTVRRFSIWFSGVADISCREKRKLPLELVQDCATTCGSGAREHLCTKRVLCLAPGVLLVSVQRVRTLVRSFGCRCKLKLPVWCLAESWIWCVHQSHHHSPGQLLHQGTCETPDALSCLRF